MPVEVRLPKLGEGVVEGTISRWLKQEGDTVEELEPLLEVATDKVDTEIPAPASGTVLKLLYPEGATVAVDAVIAYIGEPGEAVPEGEPAPAAQSQPAPEPPPPPAPAVQPEAAPAPPPPPAPAAAPPPPPAAPPPEKYKPGRHPQLGYISPLVAKLANEKGINLALVKGSGLNGRITKEDVLAYLESAPAAPRPTAAPPPLHVPAAAPRPPAPPPGAKPAPAPMLPGDTIAPLNRMRKSIAEHMVRSKFTAPHAVTVMEADLSRVVAHRAAHKAEFAQAGVRLTFTPYFIAAAAQALRAFPLVNTSWSEEGLIWHQEVNIGMAVSLDEDGLIVPVIRHADELSLLGLARAVNDLAERARSRKLRPDEISGSTFSVTNHGVTGSLFAAPIINQPNVAIMGTGAIKKRAVVITDELGNDSIAIRPMVYLSLSFDHRVVDGAVADMFLGKVVEILEGWR